MPARHTVYKKYINLRSLSDIDFINFQYDYRGYNMYNRKYHLQAIYTVSNTLPLFYLCEHYQVSWSNIII